MLSRLKKLGRPLICFRVGTLLFATTVVAVTLGLWASRSRQQAEAVAALRNLEVNVFYSYQGHGTSWNLAAPPPGPDWLLDSLGVDYLYSAVHVDVKRLPLRLSVMMRDGGATDLVPLMRDKDYALLANLPYVQSLSVRGAPLGDTALAHIGRAKSLERVDLVVRGGLERDIDRPRRGRKANGGISDVGLRHLANLRRLKQLSIITSYYSPDQPTITDEGLALLARLAKLEELQLVRTSITGTGLRSLRNLRNLKVVDIDTAPLGDIALEHLAACENLEAIEFWSVGVTADGFRDLAGHKSLRRVKLGYTKISDAGLAHLASLPNLAEIELCDPNIADAGIAALANCGRLTRLKLFETKITDAGLAQLSKLKALQELMLEGEQLTDDAVRQLMRELPNCKVQYGFKNPQATATGTDRNP